MLCICGNVVYMKKSCLFCPSWGLGRGDGGISTARYVWQWKSRLQQFEISPEQRAPIFTEHEYCVHINMAFNLEVIEVSDAVTNHLGYGSLSPHINLLSSQKDLRYFYYICYFFSLCTGFLCWFLKKKQHTFTHRCFVLSPTFLQHDVFCLICWDKSGLETPASVAECEEEFCFSFATRGPWTHFFCVFFFSFYFGGSSLFCCSGSFMYRISFPQRTVLSPRNANGHKPRGDLAFDGNVLKLLGFVF